MNNYTCNSSKDYVFKVDREYPKELRELHPFAPGKMEIKKEVSKYK